MHRHCEYIIRFSANACLLSWKSNTGRKTAQQTCIIRDGKTKLGGRMCKMIKSLLLLLSVFMWEIFLTWYTVPPGLNSKPIQEQTR